jgi:hypothetical protein
MSLTTEVTVAAAKLAPPAAVIWAGMVGWGPQQWTYVLTSGYIVLQAAYLGWKWVREYRASRKAGAQ